MNTNEQIIKFFDQTFHDSKFQSTLEKMNEDFFQDNDHFKRILMTNGWLIIMNQ